MTDTSYPRLDQFSTVDR